MSKKGKHPCYGWKQHEELIALSGMAHHKGRIQPISNTEPGHIGDGMGDG